MVIDAIKKIVLSSLLRFFQFVPFFFVVYTLSNILYLSFISFFPKLIEQQGEIVFMHLLLLGIAAACIWKYRSYFKIKTLSPSSLLLMIPILAIILMRFPLLYPTYDDLAVHLVYGDLANTMWNDKNFAPLDFLTYFYLILDVNYTPFLHTIGIRLTILLFDIIATVWLFSVITRIKQEVKSELQRTLLDALFLIIPFIPHVMATMGTLMFDYLTIPIGLEALYLFIKKDQDKTWAVHMTILLILSKLSPATFVILPLAYYIVKQVKNIRWLEVIVFGTIASSYFVRQYMETGSPLFGLYNGIFMSPLYPLSNFSNPVFGPHGALELLSWPVIAQFTDRYAEGVVATYAKLFFAPLPILGYVLSLTLVFRKRSVKYTLIVLSYLLWSLLAGYARYFALLNIFAVLIFILDLRKTPAILGKALRFRALFLLAVAVLSMSSFKTDFSWRPYPSFSTPGATSYFMGKYVEGLRYLGKDTISALSRRYTTLFVGYDAIVTSYRGSSTFVSYMGHKQGLPMINGVYVEQHDHILDSNKVSDRLKQNLQRADQADRVLLLSDESSNVMVPALSLSQTHVCEPPVTGEMLPEFQREYFFGDVHMYNCVRR